jgi:hypothetical protein
VSHFTWNPPRQHAASAASELSGNELTITQRWVPSYVGHSCNAYENDEKVYKNSRKSCKQKTTWETSAQMEGPCHKILRHVEETYEIEEILCRQISAAISRQVSSASLLDVSTGNCQRALVDVSRMTTNQMGTHNRTETIAVQGSPSAPTP